MSSTSNRTQHAPDRLNDDLDAIRTAGHVLGPWGPPDPELVEDLDLPRDARQSACTCGLVLLAGRHATGELVTIRAVSGVYRRDADERMIDADLQARWHGPCPAAHALAEFHASAGYRGLAEAYHD
jgi:hypothetical protein